MYDKSNDIKNNIHTYIHRFFQLNALLNEKIILVDQKNVAHAQRQNKSTDMVNRLPLGQSMVTKCKTCIMYDQDSNIQDALQQEVVLFKCFAELY